MRRSRSWAITRRPGRSAAGSTATSRAGTRVPFVVRWPARVKPAVSDALISQVDLHRVVRGARGFAVVRSSARRDSENVLPALLGTSKTGARGPRRAGRVAVAQAGQLEIHRAGQGPQESSRTRTPSSATIRSRSSTIWRRTQGSGTISPRRVRRRCASWPRCWTASGAPRAQPDSRQAPEHRPRHRRRLVVPSRRHLRGSDRQHAEFRSCRAGRGPVHARLRRGAVVHAVTRGAADRSGRAPS